MCAPFRKTKYGGPTVRIFSDPGQIFHVTSNAWFLLTLPRFGVKKDKYIFLALSSVVRILELADLDDVFAEQNGSAQLQEAGTFILSQVMMLAIDENRWSPNWKWCVWILILTVMLLESGNASFPGRVWTKSANLYSSIPCFKKDCK
jgi:hypothetical protein